MHCELCATKIIPQLLKLLENGTAAVGGLWLVCTSSSSLEQLLSGYRRHHSYMPWKHTKSNETNLISSLTNIKVKNFSIITELYLSHKIRRSRFHEINHQNSKKFGHSSSGIDIIMTVAGGMNSFQ